MSEFDRLCKEFENIDYEEYALLLKEKSLKVLPALAVITQGGLSGVEIFGSFITAAVVADGKLAEEEYALLYPMLNLFFGETLDYESCKKAVKQMAPEGKELKKLTNEMVDVLGILSKDLKEDIIIICMLICAVDGKVSLREKLWIKQLIKED